MPERYGESGIKGEYRWKKTTFFARRDRQSFPHLEKRGGKKIHPKKTEIDTKKSFPQHLWFAATPENQKFYTLST